MATKLSQLTRWSQWLVGCREQLLAMEDNAGPPLSPALVVTSSSSSSPTSLVQLCPAYYAFSLHHPPCLHPPPHPLTQAFPLPSSNPSSTAIPSLPPPLSNPRQPPPHPPPPLIPTHLPTLSSRGQRACQPLSAYWSRFITAFASPYSPSTPDGYILLCVAENKLNFAPFAHKISLCRHLTDDVANYSDMHGTLSLRHQLARLMARRSGVDVTPDTVCISNGVGACLHTLTLLLCEPGDAILIPSPAYAAFANDLSVAASALPVYVRLPPPHRLDPAVFEAALLAFEADAELNWEAHPLIDEGHFGGHPLPPSHQGVTVEEEDSHSRAAYNKAFERMGRSRKRVKAVLLTNPHNPLGLVYEREEVDAVIEWAGKRGLHVIVDEIYANSIFSPLPPPQYGGLEKGGKGAFVSALRHVVGEGGEAGLIGKEWVHVVQGLSKDFGLSGYRLGWLTTGNQAVVQAWGNVGYFCSVSNDLQSAITAVLEDELWVDEFLYSNAELLLDAYTTVIALLDGSHPALSERGGVEEEEVVEGGGKGGVSDAAFAIPYVPAVAGMFVWVDLRGFFASTASAGCECVGVGRRSCSMR